MMHAMIVHTRTVHIMIGPSVMVPLGELTLSCTL